MNETTTKIPVPIALQNLIMANNDRLKTYQTVLFNEVQEANLQMMQILKLDPKNGWKLDIDTMTYVQEQPTKITED